MPAEKHLNQNHLAAIAHGALREYIAQPQGKSAQSTPNRQRDISVFVARFNTADGAPRYSWHAIREMFGETRQASNVRVRRVLRWLEAYAAAHGLADRPICNAAAHDDSEGGGK